MRLLFCSAALLGATGCMLIPARVPQVRSVSPPLRITGQAAHVDCADPLRADTCAFSTETTVHNPSAKRVAGTMELSGFRVNATHVQVGATEEAPVDPEYTDETRPLSVDANGTETIRVRGDVQNAVGLFYPEAPIYVRHRLLAARSSRELDFTLPLARSARASDFTCIIGVDVPAGQRVELRRELPPGLNDALATATGEAPPPKSTTPPLSISEACAEPEVQVHVPAEPSAMLSGGPLVAVLLQTSPTSGRLDRLGARVGWEVTLRRWLLASMNVESDFRNSATLVPMVELASDGVRLPSENGAESMYAIPSFSAGVGVPIRVGDATAVGGRLELGVAFPFVRGFAFFDLRYVSQPSPVLPTAVGAGLAASL